MKNILYFSLFLLCIIDSSAQNELGYSSGIIDSVKVKNSPNETFAIYFPKSYNSKKPSAIVFILDPAARGKIGISPFILAAESYNYILVCSNNSKNGPYDRNIEIAERFVNHVLTAYNIDASQLYISGFSGGSRMAGSIALSSGIFQGVIACGASFRPLDRFLSPVNNFSYVGFIGDRDMNFQEMIENQTWLDKVKIKNELFILDAGHKWPKQKEILRAFDWLELQAYKKNIRIYNDSIASGIYAKNIRIADSLKANNQMVLAVQEYERIIADFNPKYVDGSVKKNISELKESKQYKDEIKEMAEISILEDHIFMKFLKKFDKDLKLGKSSDNFKSWKKELDNLENIYQKSDNQLTQKMVLRLQYRVWAMVYERAEEFKKPEQQNKLAYCKDLLNVIDSNISDK